MSVSNHALADIVTKVPAYCGSSAVNPKISTPAQWATCAKIGWDEPTTTAAHLGQSTGPGLVLLLAVAAVILVLAATRRGARAPEAG
jgi:hypothetical protein